MTNVCKALQNETFYLYELSLLNVTRKLQKTIPVGFRFMLFKLGLACAAVEHSSYTFLVDRLVKSPQQLF